MFTSAGGKLTRKRLLANNGLISNSSGLFIKANTGITVNTSGVFAATAASSEIYLLDDISSSFNSACTIFDLTSSSSPMSPGNPQNLIVVLGGIQQNPGTIYTVSGSQITFSSAPSTGDNCYIVMIGTASTSGVAGSNTQMIYNSSGVYSGTPALTFINSTANNITVTGQATGATPLTVKGAASATANLLQVANSGSVVFAINSAGVLVGNGAGLTSVPGSGAIVANSGIVSNATGVYANLASSNPGLGFTSGGLNVLVANGVILTSAGLNVLANTGIVANSSGVFATGSVPTPEFLQLCGGI